MTGYLLEGHQFAQYFREVLTSVMSVVEAAPFEPGTPEPPELTAAGAGLLRTLATWSPHLDVADLWPLVVFYRTPVPEEIHPLLPVLGRVTEMAVAVACAKPGSENRAALVENLGRLRLEMGRRMIAAEDK
jgi:hypothetical protein